MTILADMDRKDVFYWLQFHAPIIGCARDAFVEAAKKYAHELAKCQGAFERNGVTAESYVATIMDTADACLAEELRRDLGL